MLLLLLIASLGFSAASPALASEDYPEYWLTHLSQVRYKFQVLSSSPKVILIENFLSDVECDYLVFKAKPNAQRLVIFDGDGNQVQSKIRSSEGTFIETNHGNPLILSIEQRLKDLTGFQKSESLQIAHYGQGGEYRPHFDYFDGSTDKGADVITRFGQRYATALAYLVSPTSGGNTIFPKLDIKVAPTKGNMVLFFNVDKNGNVDPRTLHGGAPVEEGEKWIMNRWFH